MIVFLWIFFMLPNTEKYGKLSLHKVFKQNERCVIRFGFFDFYTQ